jgi:hypothetical protein
VVAIPLLLAPIAFVGGLYLVARFAPALAPTPSGRLASRVVDILGGAAAMVFALNLYGAARVASADLVEDFERDTSVASWVVEAFWQGGVLLAAAAAVHLLAPSAGAERERGDSPPSA